ncbi:hypothetical protein OAK01_05805 [Candidatus Nitrosopelagicus sp.]|nr:hypothetical protein [Candidatus Nitrosopelagicus sp.]
MIILGISHPIASTNAAALVRDGEILSSVEEERFTRIKQAPRMFPFNAIDWCLKNSGISYDDVDIIAIGWDGYSSKKEIECNLTEQQKDEASFWLECIGVEKNIFKFY